MSIRVICPNGHRLKVNDSLAGKVGLCPTCKARVEVPQPRHGELSEDAIMGILGPPDEEFSQRAAAQQEAPPVVSSPEGEGNSPPKKSCFKCNREISAGIHICPHCHTYIAGLTDF